MLFINSLGEAPLARDASIVGLTICLLLGTAFGAEPLKVIVFPLDSPSSSESLSWLGEGIALSVSGQIGSRSLKAVDREERIKLIEDLDLPPDAQLSRGSIIRVAQHAGADLTIVGSISGNEKNLKVAVRVFDVKALRLSGEMTANGPLSAMPQMENELAWLILNNAGFEKTRSRASFNERMRKVPNTAYANFIRSFKTHRKNEQMQLLLKALEGYSDFPEAHYYLGRIYYQQGNCDKALIHLSRSFSGEDTRLERMYMRGTCHAQKDQHSLAVQTFAGILPFSRDFQVLNNVGVAYLREGDTALALAVLGEAKRLAPADSTVMLNLAIARHLQGNDPAARSVAEEGISANSKYGMLQFVLGFLLKRQGENEKAALSLNRAKGLGINVEGLQNENPTSWCGLHMNWNR